MVQIKI